jgi:hypothetical protein
MTDLNASGIAKKQPTSTKMATFRSKVGTSRGFGLANTMKKARNDTVGPLENTAPVV